MEPNKAAALSLKLALSEDNFCATPANQSPSPKGILERPDVSNCLCFFSVDPATPHLTVEGMRQMISTAKSTNEYTPVIRMLGSIFSTPDYLNLSFLKVS